MITHDATKIQTIGRISTRLPSSWKTKRYLSTNVLTSISVTRVCRHYRCNKVGHDGVFHQTFVSRSRGTDGQIAPFSSNHARNGERKGSTYEADTSASTTGTTIGHLDGDVLPLSTLMDELDQIAPRFEIDEITSEGSDPASNRSKDGIEILEGPQKFYEVLKSKISTAKRRIYISTLYIGKTEHELISIIHDALEANPDLTISFLVDALRGTRETPKSTTASLLAPLVAEFGSQRVRIRMYHTPNLIGLKKRLLPKRINEGWGLQHMKLYGIDDEIILSGANLSEDYFTNRLDRYHVFSSKSLTDFYERIHDAVSSISFEVQPDDSSQQGYKMFWPSTNQGPNPLDGSRAYMLHASSLLAPLTSPAPVNRLSSVGSRALTQSRTYVYPIFQLSPLFLPSSSGSTASSRQGSSHSTELVALTTLLEMLQKPPLWPAQLTFTAGYFNPSPSLVQLLLKSQHQPSEAVPGSASDARPSLDVIAASPYANGFYGSKGISGLLPPAYTLLCRRFLEEAQKQGISKTGNKPASNGSVRLMEWRRGTVGEEGGWTYHAKGIWVTLPKSASVGPNITLIGSSNYTQRSYSLDLEANAIVVTTNPKLQARLREEVNWLTQDAKEMTLQDYKHPERRVGIAVRIAMWITRVVGGAL